MIAWGQLLAGPVVERLGWALVHFLWQGAAVALLLAPVLLLMRRRSANARYLVCCAALVAMAACPLATVLWTAGPAPAEPVAEAFAPPPVSTPVEVRVDAPDVALVPMPELPAVGPAPLPVPEPQPRWEAARAWADAHMAWIVAAWAAGVLALSLRLLSGWLGVWRMARSGSADGCAACRETLARLAGRMRLSRPVRVLESALARAPVVVGWLRPVILLPARALTGLTAEQLEAILAHELAHVRRHDYAANLIQTAIETLLFYHPAVHWVSRRIRLEREQCCDDLAVAACGDSAAYARALAQMAGLCRSRRPIALAAGGNSLLGRIQRIVGAGEAREGASSGRWLAGALAVVVVLALAAVPLVRDATAASTAEAEFERAVVHVDSAEGPDMPPTKPSTLADDGAAPGWYVGGRIEFLDVKEDGGTETYHWRVTAQTDMRLVFGLQDRESGGAVRQQGGTAGVLAAGEAVEIALSVRQQTDSVEVACGAPAGADGPRLAVRAPPSWRLRQAHALEPLPFGRAHYQALWGGDVVEVTEHGTTGARTVSFLVRAAPAAGAEAAFAPPAEQREIVHVPVDSSFILQGKVIDTDGRPVPDAVVRVATGMGTLLGGGRTITGLDGRYRLPFGPGMRLLNNESAPMGVGVQAAVASVELPGYYEANMSRQGDLAMAESEELLRNKTYGGRLESGRFVLPDRPYELNFTIAPGIRLRGTLVDTAGQPVADRYMWIATYPLPPACSVLATTNTDAEGAFEFDCLPVGAPVWLGIRHMVPGGPEHGVDLATGRHTFSKTGGFDVRVTYDEKAGTLRLGDPRRVGGAVRAKAATAASLRACSATLPNGGKVELLGLSYHPSSGCEWWAPDGTPLAGAPVELFGDRPGWSPGEGLVTYEWVLRVSPGPNGSTAEPASCGFSPNPVPSLPGYAIGAALPYSAGMITFPEDVESLTFHWRVHGGEDAATRTGMTPGRYLVEFRNVSLMPGHATDVQVAVEDTKAEDAQEQAQPDFETRPAAPQATANAVPGVEPAWGEAPEGIRIRCWPRRTLWRPGEVPALGAELNNRGRRRLLAPHDQRLCEIELDGEWYRWAAGDTADAERVRLVPGGSSRLVQFALASDWHRKGDGQPLAVAEGTHTVRVAFPCDPADGGTPLRVESLPVEIHVRPEEAAAPAEPNPELFRQEMALAEQAADAESKVQHLRNALRYRPNDRDNIAIEYQVASAIAGSVRNPRYEGDKLHEAYETCAGIVRRYHHMDYYTKEGASSPWDPEVLVPYAAHMAAVTCGDPAAAASFLPTAMVCLRQTHDRRTKDWLEAPQPQPEPEVFDPFGRSVRRAALWRERRERAAAGTVLTPVELQLAGACVTASVATAQPDRAAEAFQDILKDFPTEEEAAALKLILKNVGLDETPVSRLAAEELARHEGGPHAKPDLQALAVQYSDVIRAAFEAFRRENPVAEPDIDLLLAYVPDMELAAKLRPVLEWQRDEARQAVLKQRLHGLGLALMMHRNRSGGYPKELTALETLGYLDEHNPLESFDFGGHKVQYVIPQSDDPNEALLYHWPPFNGGTYVLYQNMELGWVEYAEDGRLTNPRTGAVIRPAAGWAEVVAAATAWGPVQDGLQAGLAFEGGRESCRMGEAVGLVLTVRNVSNRPLWLTYTDPEVLTQPPDVLDASDRRMPAWMPLSWPPSRRIVERQLAPGQEQVVDRPKLSFWEAGWEGEVTHSVVYGGPGRHRIRLNWQNDGTWRHPKSWSLVTGQVLLDVLPGQRPERVREVSAELAWAASADVESVLALLGDYFALVAPVDAESDDAFQAQGEARRAWHARCPSLSPGAVNYLGHLAASHPDAGYRAAACEAIGGTGNGAAAEMLVDPLGDESPGVRMRAARALGSLRSQEHVPDLIRLLAGDPVADVRSGAVYALRSMSDERVVPALSAASQRDADVHVRRAAGMTLRGLIGDAAPTTASRMGPTDPKKPAGYEAILEEHHEAIRRAVEAYTAEHPGRRPETDEDILSYIADKDLAERLRPALSSARIEARRTVLKQRLHGLGRALMMHRNRPGGYPKELKELEALGYLDQRTPLASFDVGDQKVHYVIPQSDDPYEAVLYHWPPFHGEASVLYQNLHVDSVPVTRDGQLVNPLTGAMIRGTEDPVADSLERRVTVIRAIADFLREHGDDLPRQLTDLEPYVPDAEVLARLSEGQTRLPQWARARKEANKFERSERLQRLGSGLRTYRREHGRSPERLDEQFAAQYLGEPQALTWPGLQLVYCGPDADPVAYWWPPVDDGTRLLFADGATQWVETDKNGRLTDPRTGAEIRHGGDHPAQTSSPPGIAPTVQDRPRLEVWKAYPALKEQLDAGLAALPGWLETLEPESFARNHPATAKRAEAEEARLRVRAFRDMEVLRDVSALPILVKAIDSPDPEVRRQAACRLAKWVYDEYHKGDRIPPAKLAPLLPVFVDTLVRAGDEPNVRAYCFQAIGSLAGAEWLPLVRDLASSRHPAVTHWSAWAVEQLTGRFAGEATGPEAAERVQPAAGPVAGMANVVRGPVVIGLPIPLSLGAARPVADGELPLPPSVIGVPHLTFTPTDGGLSAVLQLTFTSWPHTRWTARLELLGADEQIVAASEAGIENSGAIERVPLEEERTARFTFVGLTDMGRVRTFRLNFETLWTEQGGPWRLGEDIPLSLGFTGAQFLRMLQASGLRFRRGEDGVECTVHVDVCSYPNQSWNMVLALHDEKGGVLGRGEAVFGNSGMIMRYPGWSAEDIRIHVGLKQQDLTAARGFNLRITRVQAERQAAPEAPEGAVTFGPVIERFIRDEGKGKGDEQYDNMSIDLDTGRLLTVPLSSFGHASLDDFLRWAEGSGADAVCNTAGPGDVLLLLGMTVQDAPDGIWDSITPQSIPVLAPRQQSPGVPEFLSLQAGRALPATYYFRTREGGLGILQVVGFTEQSRAVHVRYKMAQDAGRAEGTTLEQKPGAATGAIEKEGVTFQLVPDRPDLGGAVAVRREQVEALWQLQLEAAAYERTLEELQGQLTECQKGLANSVDVERRRQLLELQTSLLKKVEACKAGISETQVRSRMQREN